MTRDAALLRRVGSALLKFGRQPFTLRRWLVAADAFDLAEPAAAQALYKVRVANVATVVAVYPLENILTCTLV